MTYEMCLSVFFSRCENRRREIGEIVYDTEGDAWFSYDSSGLRVAFDFSSILLLFRFIESIELEYSCVYITYTVYWYIIELFLRDMKHANVLAMR